MEDRGRHAATIDKTDDSSPIGQAHHPKLQFGSSFHGETRRASGSPINGRRAFGDRLRNHRIAKLAGFVERIGKGAAESAKP